MLSILHKGCRLGGHSAAVRAAHASREGGRSGTASPMSSTSLSAIRASSAARLAAEKAQAERKRAALVLCLRHLSDHGYVDAVAALEREANVSLAKVGGGGDGGARREGGGSTQERSASRAATFPNSAHGLLWRPSRGGCAARRARTSVAPPCMQLLGCSR